MTKEVPEISLQKYIVDNCHEFNDDFIRLFDSPVASAYLNPIREDLFPDITFKLKNGQKIPVEVEWKTSKFDHVDNPLFPKFKNEKGLIMVVVQEDNVNLGLEQIKVDRDKFAKWYVNDSHKRVEEELKDLDKLLKTKKRRQPRLWFTLLTKKGGAHKHFEPALEHQTWGIQKKYKVKTGKGTRLEEIQKGDLIVFLAGLHGSYKSKKTGKVVYGRYNMSEWTKSSFNGKFDYICIFRVTHDYFQSNEPKIWEVKSQKQKRENELFPHRFNFDRNPLLIMTNLSVKKLSDSTKSELQNVVYVNFRMCSESTLVDIMHNAEQVSIDKYEEKLHEIPKIK